MIVILILIAIGIWALVGVFSNNKREYEQHICNYSVKNVFESSGKEFVTYKCSICGREKIVVGDK